MRSASILILVTILSACAMQPVTFYKPGATAAEFEQAKAQCMYEARAATQLPNLMYRTTIVAAYDQVSRERELTTMCLNAKGFFAR